MCRPTIICLTPVKNESWILDRFLACASLWADHIIIADQQSDDGSRDIAQRYSKVILLDNTSPTYDEGKRIGLLLDAARRVPGPRLLIALDADEILSANFMDSREWASLLIASPGTVALFERAAIMPDIQSYWLESKGYAFPLGFMDDGSEHIGNVIHSARLPNPDHGPKVKIRDIKVLHFQYADWQRMESKHRWYQCWERLNRPTRRAAHIYRQYHHMYAVSPTEKLTIPAEWVQGYQEQGIDLSSNDREPVFQWDREVLALMTKHGAAMFRREAIWDVDWAVLAELTDTDVSQSAINDPRSRPDRLIQAWLQNTQPYASKLPVKLVDKSLQLLGW